MRKRELFEQLDWQKGTCGKRDKIKDETLENIQRRFQVLMQDSQEVFEIINSDGTIQYISPAVEKILGYKPAERIGKIAYEILDTAEKNKFIQMVDFVFNHPNQVAQGKLKIKTKAGNEIYVAIDMLNEITEPAIKGIILNWREILSPSYVGVHVQDLISIDELTKLPNRTAFDSHIAHEIEEAKKNGEAIGLLIVDIDRFKYINGYLGYELGDQLLTQISQRLRSILTDRVFLCRFSGDQFAVVCPTVNQQGEYADMARDILRLFECPFLMDDHHLDVSVRIGISIFPQDAHDADSLIKFANIALLRGKVEGKKRYEFYSAEIENKKYKEFLLRSDMLKALEEGQLKVHYQPMVNLHSNEILAVEALLRWEHPQCGMVSPAEFIPLMEETGFIVDVGKWLLKEVCLHHRKWQSEGVPPIKVSINYSSIQFAEEHFVENILMIIDKQNFDPSLLIIEITESVLIDNESKFISDIQRLQETGIKIALDDFGTGFSSLSYLSTFNIDILKIDGSFVQKIPSNRTSTIITHSVINLARELNIKLVAEGIETLEQLSYLQKFNCHTGQGYLYSKPIPPQKLVEVLATRKCVPKIS